MRWKRCVAPGGSKCVKIIERSPDGKTMNHFSTIQTLVFFFSIFSSGEMNYVRGCINQIEAVRPEMPTVRENGCWTATDNYVVCRFFFGYCERIILCICA